MKKRIDVELPVIDVIEDTPDKLLLEYIRKHGSIISPIAAELLGGRKRPIYWLNKMEDEGILVSVKKLVKLKGEEQFHLTKIYTIKGSKK